MMKKDWLEKVEVKSMEKNYTVDEILIPKLEEKVQLVVLFGSGKWTWMEQLNRKVCKTF